MKSPLLQSLFDEDERRPDTVSEVNERVKSVLERSFKSVWLEGEITDFVEARSGHWYFTLRDDSAQMKAACYRGANIRIQFKPFDGLQVRVTGKITVYEPRGEYQILVESLVPFGEGAMKVAFEQLKLKLAKEGLFAPEIKRALPFFPKRVGVVTSPNGAAIHDILQVLSRRTRTVDIVLIPTRVQGENVGAEIRDAIELANEFHYKALQTNDKSNTIDVLIVGRGGGSTEDLWAFNDERVARAIRNSLIPVISAVGHEIDFTIADFVADFRAPTPSAAAEIVAAQESQIQGFIEQTRSDLQQLIEYKILQAKSEFRDLQRSRVFVEIPQRINSARQQVEMHLNRLQTLFVEKNRQQQRRFDNLKNRLAPANLKAKVSNDSARLQVLRQKLDVAMRLRFDSEGEKLAVAAGKLNALSPLAVLHRGYSLAQTETGAIVQNSGDVQIGDVLRVKLANGALNCRVVEKAIN